MEYGVIFSLDIDASFVCGQGCTERGASPALFFIGHNTGGNAPGEENGCMTVKWLFFLWILAMNPVFGFARVGCPRE